MTREEAIARIKDHKIVHKMNEPRAIYISEALDMAIEALEQEPKTGHWIEYGIPRCGEQHYKCTSCGYYINFGQWGELYTKEFKYCPHCGARMVEPTCDTCEYNTAAFNPCNACKDKSEYKPQEVSENDI